MRITIEIDTDGVSVQQTVGVTEAECQMGSDDRPGLTPFDSGTMALQRASETRHGLTQDHKRIISYLWDRGNRGDCPEYMLAHEIAVDVAMTPDLVASIMSGLFNDVDGINSANGYDMERVMDALASKFSIS